MAAVAVAQQPSGAVALMPKVYGRSKLDLSKPFTHKLRRIITNETDKLIKTRNELDQALLAETKQRQNETESSDSLSREVILKLSDALSRREAEHIRRRNKLIEKRNQLYRWSPSPERQIDLELLQALQWKFKRNLKACLSNREQVLHHKDVGSNITTKGANGAQNDMVSKIDANFGSASQKADSDMDRSHNDRLEGTLSGPVSRLDGSFDDYARDTSKKRKLADDPSDMTVKKERRTPAKKEQESRKDQTRCSGSLSLSNSGEEEGAESAGELAAINSMFQSRKKLMVEGDGKVARIKTEVSDVSETTVASSSLIKTKENATKAIRAKSSITKTSSIQNESPVEPWYKIHARAMMDPEFNDMRRLAIAHTSYIFTIALTVMLVTNRD